jgi:hypothetical protein
MADLQSEPVSPGGIDTLVFPADGTSRLLDGCSKRPEEALPDADLQRILAAWPKLPAHIRAAVLALIAAGGQGTS